MPADCERLAGLHTLNKGIEDIVLKGTDTMTNDDNDKRLTPTQRAIRDRNNNLPKHLRRSIDRYRVALGMPPLWGSSVERKTTRR